MLAAVLSLHSPLVTLFTVPAAALHAAVLVAFGASKRPGRRAYFAVLRTPGLLALALIVAVPLASLAGPSARFLLAWLSALVSLGTFHMEYQSVRESERNLGAGALL